MSASQYVFCTSTGSVQVYGVIPTSRLPDVLHRIGQMSAACGLKVANIFHAGDGNLHPLIMYDANDPASFHAAETFGADILKLCVEAGGC